MKITFNYTMGKCGVSNDKFTFLMKCVIIGISDSGKRYDLAHFPNATYSREEEFECVF